VNAKTILDIWNMTRVRAVWGRGLVTLRGSRKLILNLLRSRSRHYTISPSLGLLYYCKC